MGSVSVDGFAGSDRFAYAASAVSPYLLQAGHGQWSPPMTIAWRLLSAKPTCKCVFTIVMGKSLFFLKIIMEIFV